MASQLDGVLVSSLQDVISKSKILVVGAGGIGCEILKNLVLSGIQDIDVVSILRRNLFPSGIYINFVSDRLGYNRC